jgi:hypothetical protein
LAGAPVTLAGPVSFGCPEDADGADGAVVEPAGARAGLAWPAVGSTAWGWAVGTVPVAVNDDGLDDRSDGREREVWGVPEGGRTETWGRSPLEPHPAASTITAIAVTPAARIG